MGGPPGSKARRWMPGSILWSSSSTTSATKRCRSALLGEEPLPHLRVGVDLVPDHVAGIGNLGIVRGRNQLLHVATADVRLVPLVRPRRGHDLVALAVEDP